MKYPKTAARRNASGLVCFLLKLLRFCFETIIGFLGHKEKVRHTPIIVDEQTC